MTGERDKSRSNGGRGHEDLSDQSRVRVQQQAVVADLGVYALAGADLQPLMDEAVRQVAKTLDMDYCKVLELLPSGDELLLKAGVGWKEGLVGRGIVGTDHDSQAGYTLRSKEPVIVRDLPSESRFRGPSLLVEHEVVSGMSVIIYGSDGPYGVLGTHSREQRLFSRDDIHFIQAVANILGSAVERKRFEARLRAAQADLERRVEERTAELKAAYEELEAFSYSVSHDLRAPLRGIEGFSQALREDYGHKLDAQARSYIDRVTAAASRMSELIDNLLKLSRYATAELHSAEVDLSRVAVEIVAELQASDPGRTVEVTVSEELSSRGDESLVRVVLENLLGNAWKFTRGRNPARVEVGRNGEAFYVRDNGAGFDMEYAETIFAPFHRLHGQEKFEGTGIGLATVRRVINRHGGRIWAEGEPGRGATFYFTLTPAS